MEIGLGEEQQERLFTTSEAESGLEDSIWNVASMTTLLACELNTDISFVYLRSIVDVRRR